jgi:chromosome segregation ATPase
MTGEERAARISAGLKARFEADPDYRARLAEAMRRRWQDPEFRARQLAANAERQKAPALRARITASRRKKKPTGRPLTLRELERSLKVATAGVAKLSAENQHLRTQAAKAQAALAEASRDLALARERIERLERELREARYERVSAASIARRLVA